MLTTDDVAELFQAMRTAYGGQWKHGPQAVKVWRNAMANYSQPDVMRAATDALNTYADHPPTLPQFMRLLRGPEPRANTYLPAPKFRHVEQVANKCLLRVLIDSSNVDSATMRHMVKLKNALIEDHGRDKADEDFVKNLCRELSALAKSTGDRETLARESETARQRFKRSGRAV